MSGDEISSPRYQNVPRCKLGYGSEVWRHPVANSLESAKQILVTLDCRCSWGERV